MDVSKRGDTGGRAGTRALSLLGTSPNAAVLQALADGSCSLAELRGRIGSPGSTLRNRIKDLVRVDAIATRHEGGSGRAAAEYELTAAGMELLAVAKIVQRWLAESPKARRPIGGDGAKAAIAALAEGWSATLLRALAAKRLSIPELDSLIKDFNYPSLERRIAAMRLVGEVEACPANGRETPYGVTTWLRRGVAPLLAAIRWEQLHLAEDGAPVEGIDAEAIFLLAMPLLELEGELSGGCRLSIELAGDRERRFAGALVELREGALSSCTSRLNGSVEAWASGSVAAWLAALIEHDIASLEFGGDDDVARGVVGGLHSALFGATPTREKVSVSALEDLAEPAL